ncbi:glutathione S-transferase domain-containing protein [Rhizodiscina lignyota]|uniref:Glutathione S-transferase domain-containing protein n=1 Tax=Rhizodiscina lignyota TaxID=1504668 RepID=A0A9P4IMB6_9PEZI|nr:glutathione S-transferase domain-containing protein [Rhizodiscina lignyota]
MAKLFLHDHPVSSYAQKVRIALREKGIPFDYKTPDGLGSGSYIADLHKANPRHEVPALVDGDFTVWDSSVILGYLEDKFPEHPLLPADPKGRASAKMIEEICDTQYEAINWGYGEVVWQSRATGDLQEKMVAEIKRQTSVMYSWLESELGSNDYFNGSTFGYADVCVAPMMNRGVIIDLGPAKGTPLQKWHERIQQHESVRSVFEEVAEGAKKMAKTGDFFQKGGRAREYRDHRLEWMIKSGGLEVVLNGLKNQNIRFCRAPGE